MTMSSLWDHAAQQLRKPTQEGIRKRASRLLCFLCGLGYPARLTDDDKRDILESYGRDCGTLNSLSIQSPRVDILAKKVLVESASVIEFCRLNYFNPEQMHNPSAATRLNWIKSLQAPDGHVGEPPDPELQRIKKQLFSLKSELDSIKKAHDDLEQRERNQRKSVEAFVNEVKQALDKLLMSLR